MRTRAPETIHIRKEATGRYNRAVARFLHQQGYVVSVNSLARTIFCCELTGQYIKTAKPDARLLAEFCATHDPQPSTPPEGNIDRN